MRSCRLPFAFHSLGREGVKSVRMLWILTMLRRVAKYCVFFVLVFSFVVCTITSSPLFVIVVVEVEVGGVR